MFFPNESILGLGAGGGGGWHPYYRESSFSTFTFLHLTLPTFPTDVPTGAKTHYCTGVWRCEWRRGKGSRHESKGVCIPGNRYCWKEEKATGSGAYFQITDLTPPPVPWPPIGVWLCPEGIVPRSKNYTTSCRVGLVVCGRFLTKLGVLYLFNRLHILMPRYHSITKAALLMCLWLKG